MKFDDQPADMRRRLVSYCTEAGERVLGERIERHWRARGFDVKTHVVKDEGIFGVRSNLVNGAPVPRTGK